MENQENIPSGGISQAQKPETLTEQKPAPDIDKGGGAANTPQQEKPAPEVTGSAAAMEADKQAGPKISDNEKLREQEALLKSLDEKSDDFQKRNPTAKKKDTPGKDNPGKELKPEKPPKAPKQEKGGAAGVGSVGGASVKSAGKDEAAAAPDDRRDHQ